MAIQIEMGRPADLAGAYTRGVQTAAQIREAQQRLEAQAAETNARLQQSAQQQQREQAVEQQRLAVTQAYHQQEVALKKQQLNEAAAMNAQKTAAAARAFTARQTWEKGLGQIDADPNLTDEQKQAKKTQFIMRMAPSMNIPGTEASAMISSVRTPKPTVPATVTDKGDFLQVTQPNGTVTIHPKPNAGKESSVNVMVSDAPGGTLKVPGSKVRDVIRDLPEDVQQNAVNVAAMKLAPRVGQGASVPRGTTPAASESKMNTPVTKLDTPADVQAAFKAGKLTREQAAKMLKEDFGWKE